MIISPELVDIIDQNADVSIATPTVDYGPMSYSGGPPICSLTVEIPHDQITHKLEQELLELIRPPIHKMTYKPEDMKFDTNRFRGVFVTGYSQMPGCVKLECRFDVVMDHVMREDSIGRRLWIIQHHKLQEGT